MRVFIKTGINGFPETETNYNAWQGFQELGFRPLFYSNEKELSGCTPNDLIVGGVGTIVRKLKGYGIQIPEYDYPEELSRFLGRRIWNDTMAGVLSKQEQWPVFVKPVRDKAFVGFVLRSEKDIAGRRQIRPDEPVLCSEPVSFDTEWRAFVRYGKIWDVRPYRGDWHRHFDPEVPEQAVKAFKSAPAGYAIDIGVTEKGQTLPVEINDGFALGCYGADPVQYARTLSARWCELVGIRDECDTYLEAVDWKNRMHPHGSAV